MQGHPFPDDYRRLVDRAPVMLWRCGAGGERAYVNPAWVAFTGGDDWHRAVHPDDLDACLEAQRRALDGGAAFELEYRLRRADGVHCRVVDRAVVDDGGMVGVTLDVHPRRGGDVARARYLAVVAHELRTPLQALQMFFEIIRQKVERGELPSRIAVERAVSQVRRFGALIGDLGDFSRIERGGGLQIQAEPMDLRPVVEGVVALHRDTVRRRDALRAGGAHSLVLDVVGDRFALLGDSARLDQVVFNLIENALKFSPAGGEVRVVLDHDDGWHRLSVSDHGIGIPAADLPRIGERFFRASNATPSAVPGTGIGLSIIQEIVHAHGGRLDVVSTVGEGTVVTIRLAGAPGVA